MRLSLLAPCANEPVATRAECGSPLQAGTPSAVPVRGNGVVLPRRLPSAVSVHGGFAAGFTRRRPDLRFPGFILFRRLAIRRTGTALSARHDKTALFSRTETALGVPACRGKSHSASRLAGANRTS